MENDDLFADFGSIDLGPGTTPPPSENPEDIVNSIPTSLGYDIPEPEPQPGDLLPTSFDRKFLQIVEEMKPEEEDVDLFEDFQDFEGPRQPQEPTYYREEEAYPGGWAKAADDVYKLLYESTIGTFEEGDDVTDAPPIIGELYNTVRSNIPAGMAAVDADRMESGTDYQGPGGQARFAADMAAWQEEIKKYPPSERHQILAQKMNEAGVAETLELYAKNPDYLASMLVGSLARYAPAFAVDVASAKGPLPARLAAGAAGVFAMEYGDAIASSLTEAGLDATDPRMWEWALNNEEFMEAARERGDKRGITIASFNVLGRVFNPVILRAARGPASAAFATGAATTVDALIEGAGEAVAMMWTDGKITVSEAIAEGLAAAIMNVPGLRTEYHHTLAAMQGRKDGKKLKEILDTVIKDRESRGEPTVVMSNGVEIDLAKVAQDQTIWNLLTPQTDSNVPEFQQQDTGVVQQQMDTPVQMTEENAAEVLDILNAPVTEGSEVTIDAGPNRGQTGVVTGITSMELGQGITGGAVDVRMPDGSTVRENLSLVSPFVPNQGTVEQVAPQMLDADPLVTQTEQRLGAINSEIDSILGVQPGTKDSGISSRVQSSRFEIDQNFRDLESRISSTMSQTTPSSAPAVQFGENQPAAGALNQEFMESNLSRDFQQDAGAVTQQVLPTQQQTVTEPAEGGLSDQVMTGPEQTPQMAAGKPRLKLAAARARRMGIDPAQLVDVTQQAAGALNQEFMESNLSRDFQQAAPVATAPTPITGPGQAPVASQALPQQPISQQQGTGTTQKLTRAQKAAQEAGQMDLFEQPAATTEISPEEDLFADLEQESQAKAAGPDTTDFDISDEVNIEEREDGSLIVEGDIKKIRSKIPETIKGVVLPKSSGKVGLRFTALQARRVKNILSGKKLAFGGADTSAKAGHKKNDKGEYVYAPKKFNTDETLPELQRWLRQLTEEGEYGKDWYEDSSSSILRFVGGRTRLARKFVKLLSIYSPLAAVAGNTTMALRAWFLYHAGLKVQGVRDTAKDSKVPAVIEGKDTEEDWKGEKTGNFLKNLLINIDKKVGEQGSTIDMWMMRAAQYDHDAPSTGEYAFMEVEIKEIADEIGWKPHQVQAAIWVAMKARFENPGVKSRTEERSEKAGYMHWGVDENGKKVREIDNEAKHRDLWLEEALKHEPTQKDYTQAGFNYADGMRRHMGQLSWEAQPSKDVGILPKLQEADYDTKRAYLDRMLKIIYTNDGANKLGSALGLIYDKKVIGPGIWRGDINPGVQDLTVMVQAAGKEGGAKEIEPAQVKLLEAYSAALGYLFHQDAVGYYKILPASKGGSNMVQVDIGRPLSPEQTKSLEAALIDELGKLKKDYLVKNKKIGRSTAKKKANPVLGFMVKDVYMTASPLGVNVINGNEMYSHDKFHQAVERAIERVNMPRTRVTYAKTKGDLIENNWRENPNGEDYKSKIIAGGGSEFWKLVDSDFRPAVERARREFAKEQGWSEESLEFSLPEEGTGVVPETSYGTGREGSVQVVGVHYSNFRQEVLDSSKYGTGLRGGEANRISAPDAVKNRTYFYVDEGEGIRPEFGVGGIAHTVELNNLYNWKEDPNGYWAEARRERPTSPAERANYVEARVVEDGYDGIYAPGGDGNQGVAVLLGSHKVDLKKKSTKSRSGVREEIVKDKELKGTGLGFKQFFSDVVTGKKGKKSRPNEYSPVIESVKDPDPEVQAFDAEYQKHRGNFDDHITYSIPGFKDIQLKKGVALTRVFGPQHKMLDIGASEGPFAKAITAIGGMKTHSFDPNPDMAASFARTEVPGATYDVAGFSSKEEEGKVLWTEDDGTEIKGFVPDGKYDVIHETMVFQFISNSRGAQIARIKEMMKANGVAIIEEKVHTGKKYDANEAKKDEEFKSLYFTPEEMEAKRKEVLEKGGDEYEGMSALQVTDKELDKILSENFRYVYQYWDSGNFRGYIASDNRLRAQRLVNAIGDTDSKFANIETPRTVNGAELSFSLDKDISPSKAGTLNQTDSTDVKLNALRKLLGKKDLGTEIMQPQDAATGRMIKAVSELIGKEIILVDPKGLFNGVVHSGYPNTIFLNGKASRPLLAVLGHEYVHTLAKENPKEFRDFASAMIAANKLSRKNVVEYRDEVNAARAKIGQPPIDNFKALEEIVADFSGEVWRDPEFWSNLSNENPTAFRKIADSFIKFLDKILSGLLGKSHLRAKRYIEDIESTKKIVHDHLNRMAAEKSTTSKQTEESLDFELGEPNTTDNDITLLDKVAIKFAQRHRVLLRKVAEAGPQPEERDVAAHITTMPGVVKARIDQLEKDHLEPIHEAVRNSKQSLDEIGAFLLARHAQEANDQLKKLHPDKQHNDRMSGMDNDTANEILAKYQNDTNMQLIGTLVDRMNNEKVQMLLKDGLLSNKEAAQWRTAYRHWVPLNRAEAAGDLDTGGPLPSRGAGFAAGDPPSRRRAGSLRRVDYPNILARVFASYESAILRSEKNHVSQALYRFIENNPSDMWELDNLPGRSSVTGDEVKYTKNANASNVVKVRFDGEPRYIVFNEGNKVAQQVLFQWKNLGSVQIGFVTKSLGKINRYLAAINTSMSPEFMVSNLFRDFQTAVYNMTDTELKDLKWKTTKAIPKAMAGLRDYYRGEGQSDWGQWAERMEKAGGMVGWHASYDDLRDRTKEIQRMIRRDQGAFGQVTKYGRKVGDFIEDYNKVVEGAVRLAAFRTAVESGIPEKQAAKISKELTVDFNAKGEYGTALNAAYLFSNASIQGSVRMMRAIARKDNHKLHGMIAATVVASALNEALQIALLDDDEYAKIDDQMRSRNLVIPDFTGLTDDGFVKIPLPWGYNIFHVLGQEIARAGMSLATDDKMQDYDVVASSTRLLLATLEAFNPVHDGSLPLIVSPTFMDPWFKADTNTEWHGGNLFPDYNEKQADHLKYFKSASDWSIGTAKKLAELTRNDQTLTSAIDISPETLDMLVDTAFGSLGRLLSDTGGSLQDLFAGELADREVKDMPMLRRFLGDIGDSDTQRLFYTKLANAEITLQRLKDLPESDRAEAWRRFSPENKNLYTLARNTRRDLNRLNRTIRTARKTGDDKLVKGKEDEKMRLMERYLQSYYRYLVGED
jgi:hypothetical protein